VLLFRDGLTWPDGTPVGPDRQGMSVSPTPNTANDPTGYVGPDRQGYVGVGRQGMSAPADTKRKEEKEEETMKSETRARLRASVTSVEEDDADALDLLEGYVQEMGRRGICRPEWFDKDIAKPEWQEAFRDGVREHGLAALVDALQLLLDYLDNPRGFEPTENWRQLLGGPRGAIAFIRRHDQILEIMKVDYSRWGWQK
jgi:hypothetical protein